MGQEQHLGHHRQPVGAPHVTEPGASGTDAEGAADDPGGDGFLARLAPSRLKPFSGRSAVAVAAIWWILAALCSAQIVWLLLLRNLDSVFALLAIPPLAAGLILRRQSPQEPVPVLLSFGFVLLAALIPGFAPHWNYGGDDQAHGVITGACLGFLITAFAAFPDGRFVPAWTRWSVIFIPLTMIALFVPDFQDAALVLLGVLLPLSLSMLIARLRRTPVGPERQQLKWAVFGFAVGLAMFVIGFLVGVAGIRELAGSGSPLKPWLRDAGEALMLGGVLTMPVGVIISLLRYRLNDIDAVMGRSSSFAAAATVVALTWATGLALMDAAATRFLGGESAALPKVIVALAAIAVFGPSQRRVLQWAEARLRPAFVRLRTLPGRLAQWQHGEDPGIVAGGALTIIVDGIKAERGALVATAESGRRILALHAIPADSAEAAVLEVGDNVDPSEPIRGFPLVLPLIDESGRVGTILLGPRSDGASYRRDEREAVALIAAPLADALRATTDCERRNAALAAQIQQLLERIQRIEAAAAS